MNVSLHVFSFSADENWMSSVNFTYIAEDLLSLGHPAQLRAVTVRVELGLVLIPVFSVKFLNKV